MSNLNNTTLADTIRQRHAEAREALNVLREFTAGDYPLDIRIEAGSALWSLGEESQVFIEPFKKDLRQIALDALEGEGTWSSEGINEGYAKVVIPKDALRLKKGIDTALLQQTPSFDNCFEVVTTIKPRKGVGETIMKLASEDREIIIDSVESVSGTPRVSLKRR